MHKVMPWWMWVLCGIALVLPFVLILLGSSRWKM